MDDSKPMAVDPSNSKRVRFTDNGLKENDWYPENQSNSPFDLDPAGAPYGECAYFEGDVD